MRNSLNFLNTHKHTLICFATLKLRDWWAQTDEIPYRCELNAGLMWFIVATFPQIFQMIVPAQRWLDLDRLCLPNWCYLLRFCVVICNRTGSVDSLVIRLDSGNWVAWVAPVLNSWVREGKMAVRLRHTQINSSHNVAINYNLQSSKGYEFNA